MASPAEINQQLPDTLPEDFTEWDGESSPEALPNPSREVDIPRGPGEIPPAPAPAYGRDVAQVRGLEGMHGGALSSPAPAKMDGPFLRSASEPSSLPAWNAAPVPVPQETSRPNPELRVPRESPKASVPEGVGNVTRMPAPAPPSVDEIVRSLRPKLAAVPVEKKAGKKWMMIAGGGVCAIVVLVIIAVRLFSTPKPSIAATAMAPAVEATAAPSTSSAPKPSPAIQLSQPQHEAPAAPQAQQTAVSQQAAATEQDVPPQVESKEMDAQLAAPQRISRDLKQPVAKNEAPPPGFAATGIAGLAGSNAVGSVFNGAQPVVKPAPGPVRISAGLAGGLLIQKTPPVYPTIAKTARVSGTVKMQATISKTGTVKDVRILSGPAMLRQSALDAVRTWRYKPYLLDNEPTEVQTTIEITFSLGD